MMEADFRALLTAYTPLSDLVQDRIFFQVAPQDERRARVLIRLKHRTRRTLAGATGERITDASIDALAPSYQDACRLAAAIEGALQDVRFRTQGTTAFRHITTDTADDIPTMPQAGNATPTFGRNLRASVWWQPNPQA